MKNLRSPLLLLLLLVTTTLYADWQQTLRTSFEAVDGLIVPPEARSRFLQVGPDPEHDYTAEVAALMKGNPDAPFLCAALIDIATPNRMLPQSTALRAKELEMCKAYPFTPQQLDEVRKSLHPPPPPRREQIVMELQGREPSNRWFSGMGIYTPPPLDPMDWVNGNTQGRDYRKDLETDFDANPLKAATVCVSATRAHATTENAKNLLPILLDVCKAFPDSKIEAAFAAQKSNAARAWLTGLMNTLLDEAASSSMEVRRRQANELLASLPNTLRGSARFQATLRVIALTSDDWRGPAAALRYVSEASSGTPSAQPSDVRAWLEEWYSKQINVARDSWNWKRGARGFYALAGQLDRARTLAKEVANHRDLEQHSLDLIYLAAIERAAGNGAPYERLFSDCPAPDPVYAQEHGQPTRAVKYCEDVVSEFAKAIRDELRSAPAAAQFAQMALETNRVVPTPTMNAGVMPPADRTQSPAETTDDWFSAIVNAARDKTANMTRVQREEIAATTDITSHYSIGFDVAMRLVFLRPWHEAGAFVLLRELDAIGTSSSFDKAGYVKRLIAQLFEQRATSGPDADEWRRGLRGFLLFTGDYTRARDLSRELIREPEPRFATRDAVLLGLTERITGNRKPLDEAIANCSDVPAEELERYGLEGLKLAKGDPCRSMLVWDTSRATTVLHRNLPNAYKEILTEIAGSSPTNPDIKAFALSELTRLDPDKADQQWRNLLTTPKLTDSASQQAFWNLANIAEQKKQWAEGIVWVDRYIDTFAANNNFTPDLWKTLALSPEGTLLKNCALGEAYDLRLRLSIGARDYENARRTIEDMLTFDCGSNFLLYVRLNLIRLATAEAANGQRQEPLRILGYLSRQALGAYLNDQLAALQKMLGGAEPKREDTPWDSVPRKRRRINVIPPDAKSS